MLQVTHFVNTGYLLCATLASHATIELLKRPLIGPDTCEIFDDLALVNIARTINGREAHSPARLVRHHRC